MEELIVVSIVMLAILWVLLVMFDHTTGPEP